MPPDGSVIDCAEVIPAPSTTTSMPPMVRVCKPSGALTLITPFWVRAPASGALPLARLASFSVTSLAPRVTALFTGGGGSSGGVTTGGSTGGVTTGGSTGGVTTGGSTGGVTTGGSTGSVTTGGSTGGTTTGGSELSPLRFGAPKTSPSGTSKRLTKPAVGKPTTGLTTPAV